MRSVDRSKLALSGCCSRATYIVGTPSMTVQRSRWSTSSALVGSKRGSRVIVPPARTVAFIPTVWPNEWNSGSPPKTTSSGVNRIMLTHSWALLAMFAWLSSAPFGLPVVPDV